LFDDRLCYQPSDVLPRAAEMGCQRVRSDDVVGYHAGLVIALRLCCTTILRCQFGHCSILKTSFNLASGSAFGIERRLSGLGIGRASFDFIPESLCLCHHISRANLLDARLGRRQFVRQRGDLVTVIFSSQRGHLN